MAKKNNFVDDGLGDPEPKFQTGSQAWKLAQLDTGESYVEARRIPKAKMPTFNRFEEFRKIETTMSSSVQRVSAKTGRVFEVERAADVLTSGDVMLFVVATRVK